MPCHEHTSKALRYGTRSQGISQFYLHTPRSSANGIPALCQGIISHHSCDCCRLAEIVVPPRIVREMSWVCNYWPENMPYPYASAGHRTTLSALDRPEIQRYCLMSVKDSFTDFHIDFGGTSVWYHILRVSLAPTFTCSGCIALHLSTFI